MKKLNRRFIHAHCWCCSVLVLLVHLTFCEQRTMRLLSNSTARCSQKNNVDDEGPYRKMRFKNFLFWVPRRRSIESRRAAIRVTRGNEKRPRTVVVCATSTFAALITTDAEAETSEKRRPLLSVVVQNQNRELWSSRSVRGYYISRVEQTSKRTVVFENRCSQGC